MRRNIVCSCSSSYLPVYCLLLVVIHNMAHALVERYTRLAGISFLVITILVLRIMTYYFPGIFHFRQYELFDPTIYSSNFILRSLGDLLINALLILLDRFVYPAGNWRLPVPFLSCVL